MSYTLDENTARQDALYRFLLDRGDTWTSMEQTTDSVKEYPAFFSRNYHNSKTRRMLTTDIEEINSSAKYEKIIISGNLGIKLANEREFGKFIKSELREIFKKLRRVRRIAKKGSHDQQINVEGRIAEAFLKED